jgi:1-deoxy-D-xylulose-5-phosphate synthase
VSSLDTEMLDKIEPNHDIVITLEEGAKDGGFGQKIASYFGDSRIKVHNLGISIGLTQDFEPDKLLAQNGLTVENILLQSTF